MWSIHFRKTLPRQEYLRHYCHCMLARHFDSVLTFLFWNKCRNMRYATTFFSLRPTRIAYLWWLLSLGRAVLMLSAYYLRFLPPVTRQMLLLPVSVKQLLKFRLVSFRHSTLALSVDLDLWKRDCNFLSRVVAYHWLYSSFVTSTLRQFIIDRS